jgi:NAD(P)-dependent dehydrogenase (short-subunit alcohol dehydrogenase family)
MAKLDGEKILVIGGATGIGNASVRRFAAEGARLVIGDVNVDGARALAASLEEGGARISATLADLSSARSMEDAVRFAARSMDGITGLFLNGADTLPATLGGDTDIVDMDIALWDHVLSVNLRGYMLGARFAIPVMLDGGGGAIVCTSSEFSLASQGIQPAYCASKAGVNQLVTHIAACFGRRGIRCNAVAPGFILTETASQNCPADVLDHWRGTVRGPRLGRPEDIASMAAYLLSGEAAYVQGQVISVNGGTLMR